MVKIKWTEKASGDLEAIHKYIARDSKVYASRFILIVIPRSSAAIGTRHSNCNLSTHGIMRYPGSFAAGSFIKSLINATIKLETMPFCGRIVPELESYGFREIVYYNYRIV